MRAELCWPCSLGQHYACTGCMCARTHGGKKRPKPPKKPKGK